MLNFGVIASGDELHSLPTAGGQTYTGTSNYIPPVYAPAAPQAPVVSGLNVGNSLIGYIATWDAFANPPSTIYNITTYNPDGTIALQTQQSLNGNISFGFAGLATVPVGGTITVQAVASVNNVTTYSDPVVPSPTLQQLGVGGTHL